MAFDAFAALRAIWSAEGHPRGEAFNTATRAVFTSLVMHADSEGRCYPSHGRLGKATDLGKSSVIRSVNALEAAGWLVRERVAPPASTRYLLTVPQADRPTVEPSQRQTLTVPETDLDRPTVGHELLKELPKEPRGADRKGLKRSIPDGWAPNEKHLEIAKQRGLDFSQESERFRDYCEANAKKYADFDAAFRKWLRSDFQAPGPGAKAPAADNVRTLAPGEDFR